MWSERTLFEPATVRRNRPAVVLLHSSGSSSRQWNALAQALQPQFDVHPIDLHGHGNQPAWSGRDPLTLADDAGLASAACRAHDEVHLIGHSYGAVVAMQLALLHPTRVCSLATYEPVLMNTLIDEPALHPATRELLATAALLRAGLLGERPLESARHFIDYWSGAGHWGTLSPPQREAVAARMPAITAHFDALVATRPALDRLAHLPSLWLSGGATVAAARRIAHKLQQALPGAQHETLAGLGHMGPMTHAALVNERLLRFVHSHAGLANPA